MKKYKITFKEWDELGIPATRTITIETDQKPEEWFWDKYNGCDVKLLKTEEA